MRRNDDAILIEHNHKVSDALRHRVVSMIQKTISFSLMYDDVNDNLITLYTYTNKRYLNYYSAVRPINVFSRPPRVLGSRP